MTQNTNKTLPFGVSIAVGIAVKMIKESTVAPSIVLANLFRLQHSTVFPKNLDDNYFSLNQYRATDVEKKVISKIMDEMKKPNTNLKEMLTEVFAYNWAVKVPEEPKNYHTTPKGNTKPYSNTNKSKTFR